jgi:GTP-binding protein YchF
MKLGIVGLPGSGKSTLFNLLSGTFEGPDPALGPRKPRARTVKVRDARLERLRDDWKPKKYTPASFELYDFPAVEGGEEDRAGLADLLAPAREMDALILVLRSFKSAMLAGGDSVEPLRDFEDAHGELILSDLSIAERRLEKLEEKSRKPSYTDEDRKERALLERVKVALEAEESALKAGLTPEEGRRLGGFGFLSAKPFITVLSTDLGPPPGEWSAALEKRTGGAVIAVPARTELEILELPAADRGPFLQEYGIKEFQGEAVIALAYRAAGRISFFTAGDKEVRAWTIRSGSTAPQAAGAIHTDFERGFIRAEVVSYEDYVRTGGVKGAKEKGLYRLEGREYVVQDADIIEFRFSV